MNQLSESLALNTQIAVINQELIHKDLSISELIALASSLEILIIKYPKQKNSLEARLSQIEKRILRARSNYKESKPRLAESLLLLIENQ